MLARSFLGRTAALRTVVARRAPCAQVTLARREENNAPAGAAQMATLSREQIKKNRPVSPHLMIYAWPMAAISSVTMRITGVTLSLGMYFVGMGALVGADMSSTMAALGASGLGPLIKFGVSFSGVYHSACAYRHLYWEKKPDGLNPQSQTQSSIALFAGSGLLGVISMLV